MDHYVTSAVWRRENVVEEIDPVSTMSPPSAAPDC